MSADQISVNFAALQNSAASLTAKAKALTDYLDQLSQNLQPLKQSWYASGSSAGTAAARRDHGHREHHQQLRWQGHRGARHPVSVGAEEHQLLRVIDV
jgi:hypothetical protein